MIWSDPWLADPLAGPPPPPPELPAGMVFRCIRAEDMYGALLVQWRDLVGTHWPVSALQERLAGAWVALLAVGSEQRLVATCVLRPRGSAGTVWLLETFVARPRGVGYGTLLARHAVPWVWGRGCRSLVYTWELGPLALAGAWWRGWLRTAVTYEWGWALRAADASGCGFCPTTTSAEPRFVMPVLIRDERSGAWAIVSDSGLRDGWGYVLMTAGDMNWPAVLQKGGWRALWYRGSEAPTGNPDWRWTGETVVGGVIGVAPIDFNFFRLSPEI
jgi:hypothetical protein